MSSRLWSLPRLVRGVASGQYPGLSTGRLLLMVAAVAYVISPVDMFPEAVVPLLGFADDAVLIAWLAAALNRETDAYLTWEHNQANTVPSTVR